MGHLRYRQIFQFYWPLVLTSQMMTLAAPIINMGLGRSANPEVQLAAYSVGFGLLVFFNSPIFPFIQTVAVMGVGPRSRRSLFAKGITMGAAICAFEIFIATSPWGEEIFGRLMGSTPAVSQLAQKVALVQFPIALLLPVRSYYSGIVMRHRNTRIISQATGMRLALLAAVVFGAIGFGRMPGAMLGAGSLTVGILTETIYMSFRGRRLLARNAEGIDDEDEADDPVTWGEFFGFIAPLQVNAITWTSTRTILNAILGRTADPDLAQASFGFVFPLLVLSASPLWAFQSTTVVLAKRREDLVKLLRFGGVTIAFFVFGIGVVVWTPLRDAILGAVFSLQAGLPLHALVVPALMIIPYQPVTLGLRTISQGFLMSQRRTRAIGVASFIKVVLITVAGILVVRANPTVNGALLGTLLMMGGESLETVIILTQVRKLYRAMGEPHLPSLGDPLPPETVAGDEAPDAIAAAEGEEPTTASET